MTEKIKITPRFNQLTARGVEMLKNMGDFQNAKAWIDDFAMDQGQDQAELACLMALLEAIREKVEDPDKNDHPIDFINALQRRVFRWTMDYEAASDAYIEALKTGDFTVDVLIESEKSEPKTELATSENSINQNVLEAAQAIHTLLNNKAVPAGLFNLVGDYVADMRTDLMSAQGGETVDYIAEGLAHAVSK